MTRERLMDAALRLFAAQGVAATTVTAIEDAAGLAAGRGGFYRHFRSKDDILDAGLDRELARLRAIRPVRLPAPDGADGPTGLTSRILDDLGYLREARTLIALLLRERDSTPALVQRVGGVLVEAGAAGGALDLAELAGIGDAADDPEAAAVVSMCATIGYFLTTDFFQEMPAHVGPERFARTLATLLAAPDAD
ncbi:TetR/AcrR family transcriptional regulator [Rhodococcus daqingensis]|uniref:TetR/AcrR family transcriptional regulator n=1 Tax=Rhodococcus daqingensis TaxID=2479363 RepID=A0ABW2S2R0_9NOCA